MSSINRRELLALMAGSAMFPRIMSARASAPALRVNGARLERTLEELSAFGRPEGGTFADGVSRVAYSDADIAGRAYVLGLMRDAGLAPRIDTAGNLVGRRAGRDAAAKPILLGSHIDSVRSGGNFDGDLGSLAAVEVVRTLNEAHVVTRRPLEVRIWSNEEGGLIGSAAAAGVLPPEAFARSFYGTTLREGLRRIGGDPDRLAEARIAPGSFRCYLELHIEQGATLAKTEIPVGVVDGIVGIDEFAVVIEGFANHSGTTPMAERQDALLAAARLIDAVHEIVTRTPGRQVGTVGRLEVFPDAPNVVPGLVKHSIEIRDLSTDKLAQLGAEITARAQAIAADTHTRISVTQVEHDDAALADPGIQRQIERAAASLGLRLMHLPSGAGHDAQVLARLGPMGMIFVPSIGGISHSPRELTRWTDCGNGADVLLQTLLGIDRERA